MNIILFFQIKVLFVTSTIIEGAILDVEGTISILCPGKSLAVFGVRPCEILLQKQCGGTQNSRRDSGNAGPRPVRAPATSPSALAPDLLRKKRYEHSGLRLSCSRQERNLINYFEYTSIRIHHRVWEKNARPLRATRNC